MKHYGNARHEALLFVQMLAPNFQGSIQIMAVVETTCMPYLR